MPADDVDTLESVLRATGQTISGVRPDQADLPTPCADYDVAHLVDHLVGWAQRFAAQLRGETSEGEPGAAAAAGPDAADDFRAAADQVVAAYRDGTEASAQLPVGILLMEFVTHGWDLATATGQQPAYDERAAELALEAGHQMLKPEYRGPGKTFGEEVDAPPDAGAVERLVAFLGRRPDWHGAAA